MIIRMCLLSSNKLCRQLMGVFYSLYPGKWVSLLPLWSNLSKADLWDSSLSAAGQNIFCRKLVSYCWHVCLLTVVHGNICSFPFYMVLFSFKKEAWDRPVWILMIIKAFVSCWVHVKLLIASYAMSTEMTIRRIFKASPSFFLSHTLGLVWFEVFRRVWYSVGGDWILLNPFSIWQNIGMSVT